MSVRGLVQLQIIFPGFEQIVENHLLVLHQGGFGFRSAGFCKGRGLFIYFHFYPALHRQVYQSRDQGRIARQSSS
ncbi:hypothetical protein LIHA111178_11145 [Litorimonas haliclonae]